MFFLFSLSHDVIPGLIDIARDHIQSSLLCFEIFSWHIFLGNIWSKEQCLKLDNVYMLQVIYLIVQDLDILICEREF